MLKFFARLFGINTDNNTRYTDNMINEPIGEVQVMYGVRLDAVSPGLLIDGFKAQTKIDLSKELDRNTSKPAIDLKKHFICLNKTLGSLSSISGVDFSVHRAKVACVMDKSGSLSKQYRDGIIHEILLKIMPVALQFDDNGELDFWAFSNDFARISGMTLSNFDNYVEDVIQREYPKYGGTEFSPVLVDIYKKYCIEEPSNLPVYIIFITDGDNADKKETTKIIKELAKHNIFIKFIGTGSNTNFEYLRGLENIPKEVDNTDFFSAESIVAMNDDTLYENILRKYPEWLVARSNIKSES